MLIIIIYNYNIRNKSTLIPINDRKTTVYYAYYITANFLLVVKTSPKGHHNSKYTNLVESLS